MREASTLDVTPQNTALATKLETWLYEQIEPEFK